MLANIKKAIFDQEAISIGGGLFHRDDLAALLRQAAIGVAVEKACADLPEGFEINIVLEKGAGTVELVTAFDTRIDCGRGGTFAKNIEVAIYQASKMPSPK